MSVTSAHIDGNQNPSMIGVQGTLGTADIQGTALTIPIGVNPTNGAVYVNPISLLPTQNTNGSYIFTRDTSGYIGTITETIGTITYTKTLIRDANNYIGTINPWT